MHYIVIVHNHALSFMVLHLILYDPNKDLDVLRRYYYFLKYLHKDMHVFNNVCVKLCTLYNVLSRSNFIRHVVLCDG